MSEIIKDVVWFCGSSNVGIVKVKDPYDGYKYYIGSPPNSGYDEDEDAQWIADWGSSFPVASGSILFGDFK